MNQKIKLHSGLSRPPKEPMDVTGAHFSWMTAPALWTMLGWDVAWNHLWPDSYSSQPWIGHWALGLASDTIWLGAGWAGLGGWAGWKDRGWSELLPSVEWAKRHTDLTPKSWNASTSFNYKLKLFKRKKKQKKVTCLSVLWSKKLRK